MKKLSVVLICGFLMFLLTGCQNNNTNNPNPNTNDNANDQTDTNSSATTRG